MNKSLKFDITLLIFFIIIGGILCMFFGRDVNWDLANYHYYSVWALFNNRIGFDIMPSGIQSYFNPLMDIPFYLLAQFLEHHPRILAFIQSSYWGIAVFLGYKISTLVFNKKYKFTLILFSIIISSTGVLSILEVGTTFNDLNISVIILFALYLFLKNTFSEDSKKRTLIIFSASLLVGAAIGMKTTGVMYAAGILITEILMIKKIASPQKVILATLFGIIAGTIITGGWWHYLIWEKFQNPYFPFYNDFFKSPYALEINYLDTRHLPENLFQILTYPIYWTIHYTENTVIETRGIDYRHIALYLCFWIILIYNFCIYKLFKKNKSELEKYIDLNLINYLTIFLFIVYVIWINTSGTLRYLQTIELISGIYIAMPIVYILLFSKSSKTAKISAVILACLLLFTTKYNDKYVHRRDFDDKSLYVEDLNLPDNAVLCQIGGFPSAIVMPFQNPKTQFIYFYGEIGDYNFQYPEIMERKIKAIIDNPDKKVFLIYSDFEPAIVNWDYASKFIQKDNYNCREIDHNIQQKYYFCSPN